MYSKNIGLVEYLNKLIYIYIYTHLSSYLVRLAETCREMIASIKTNDKSDRMFEPISFFFVVLN